MLAHAIQCMSVEMFEFLPSSCFLVIYTLFIALFSGGYTSFLGATIVDL